MTDKDNIRKDCIKYCMVKAKTGNIKDVFNKISKALNNCNPTQESIRECITLLKVLENE